MRRSMPPSASAACVARVRALPRCDRSTSRTACAPSSSSSGRRRAATATTAPRASSSFASSRPIPLDAPVSSTRLPLSSIFAIAASLVLGNLSSSSWDGIKRRPIPRHCCPMPRTRPELEREAKVAEIVDAAARRLREGGYDALSVAALARELGIAQNAVYWYFPSKDHLFVAALERTMRDIMAGKPPRQRSVERKVLWFVDRLQELEHVRTAMYE